MIKTQLTLLIFSLASLIIFMSCEEEIPQSELDKLPPITTTGENTFGCLVNGKAWVPKSSLQSGAIYQNNFLFIGADDNVNDRYLTLILLDQSGEILETSFDLTDTSQFRAEYKLLNVDGGMCKYTFQNTLFGELSINVFDSDSFIISGTFEFSTAIDDCDTIHVTDGRFDLKYIP